MIEAVANVFAGIGERGYFVRDIGRATMSPRTYGPEIVAHMRRMGVDSVPLVAAVAAFIGAVTAVQSRFQLLPGVELSVVGLITRQSIILELGPLLTGLVLTGRVGARITAELGTMRVTEQIDALETLAYDPVAFLVVPRLIAAILMVPLLTIFADSIAIMAGMMAASTVGVDNSTFAEGLRLSFAPFQIFYSLLKATLFGTAIAFFCAFEGFFAESGAEGVGRSTASAVVVTSVAILMLDALTAIVLARYLI
ncbi:MAG: ABC transporter permease [Gemmatimonadaceae bacterium]|nr:ABC transporter permease [Gemmatimonadaceae bacterium]